MPSSYVLRVGVPASGPYVSEDLRYFTSPSEDITGSDTNDLMAEDFGPFVDASLHASNPRQSTGLWMDQDTSDYTILVSSINFRFGWVVSVSHDPYSPTNWVEEVATGVWCGHHGVNGFNQASRNLREDVSEFYVRWYFFIKPDYVFGAEKFFTLNLRNADSGIYWGGYGWNVGANPAATGSLEFDTSTASGGQDRRLFQNVGDECTIEDGHWYLFKARHKLNTNGNADGLWQMWLDDCGTGATPVNPVSQTLRADHNDVDYGFNTAVPELFGNLFIQSNYNAAEPPAGSPSEGERLLTNIRASKVDIGMATRFAA